MKGWFPGPPPTQLLSEEDYCSRRERNRVSAEVAGYEHVRAAPLWMFDRQLLRIRDVERRPRCGVNAPRARKDKPEGKLTGRCIMNTDRNTADNAASELRNGRLRLP